MFWFFFSILLLSIGIAFIFALDEDDPFGDDD